MNKNDLQSIGFQELNEEQLKEVNGGSIFSKMYDWLSNAIEDVCHFLGL